MTEAEVDVDIIVIGAGIQGAGVAQAASAAGYRVAVLEQYAKPAQGTSSKSSKLIHGGLRYLESGQFALVRECLVERARLLKNAPHWVHSVPFYLPVYNNSHYSSLKIAAGLSLYSLLSFSLFRRIPKKHWSTLRGLKKEGLKAVYQYQDAQTDDVELTKAVLSSALSMGAEAHYNAHFQTAKIGVRSCIIRYRQQGKDKTLRSYALVNAAGPWVKQVVESIPPHHLTHPQPSIDLVQGTHIEVPDIVAANTRQGVYYLEALQDNRAVFVMPWKKHLLIGTTETLYTGDPHKVVPLQSEIDYLLAVYNHYFEKKLHHRDVINAFAGLRVLPQGAGKAFSRPRETLIVGNTAVKARLLTVYGGKLTAYRATAEKIMGKLQPVLPEPRADVDTRILVITQ